MMRLLRNQDDIGNAIKPVYGDQAGTKLSALLRDHILIAADVVKAAKAGDAGALDAANKKWYANADDIAAFLSGANPNWPKLKLSDMLTHGILKQFPDKFSPDRSDPERSRPGAGRSALPEDRDGGAADDRGSL